MICIRCGREIEPKDRRHYSHQRGMVGWYHWDCYTVQVHIVNERGAREILYTGVTQSMIQPMTARESHNSMFESINHG